LAIGLLREAVLATNQITLKQPYCKHETTKQGKVRTVCSTRLADDPKTKVKEQGYMTFYKFDRLYVALYGFSSLSFSQWLRAELSRVTHYRKRSPRSRTPSSCPDREQLRRDQQKAGSI